MTIVSTQKQQPLPWLAAGLLVLLGTARTAAAQNTPPAPEVQAVADAPAPADSAELNAKLADADQTARIALRRVELLEEQLASKASEAKANPPASISASERGFGLKSGDGAWSFQFRGILQVDTRWFLNDGALSDKADTFLIRRFRPSVDGTLLGLVDFKFIPDFAGGAAVVFDAYLDAHPFPWLRLRVGKFKTPLGLERLQTDADLVFMERALTQDLTPVRDVGAALWGDLAGGMVQYSLGLYNGAVDGANPDLDTNHAKDVAGRLLIQPFKLEGLGELGALGLHFAFSTGNRGPGTPTAAAATATPLLPTYKSGGTSTFFSYLSSTADPAGTVFAHLRETRINPGLFYYLGPVGLLGEYVRTSQEVQKGNVTATLKSQAAHATLSYVIGGKNGYDGATPDNRLDLSKGNLGALEIGVRWNYLKVDQAAFGDAADATILAFADLKKSASKAQGWAGALTYVPSRTVRFAVNFEQTRFTGGASVSTSVTDPATNKTTTTVTVGDRKTENALFGRAQVNF
ncbi:MAG TPA: porin [Polyangia bacterium]|nr:porin [Polyangia bacterium]